MGAVIITLRPLYPRDEPQYPLKRRVVGPRAGTDELEKTKSLAPVWVRPQIVHAAA
jgi:hypothetical protein